MGKLELEFRKSGIEEVRERRLVFFFNFIQYFEMEQLVLANGRRGKEAPGNNLKK